VGNFSPGNRYYPKEGESELARSPGGDLVGRRFERDGIKGALKKDSGERHLQGVRLSNGWHTCGLEEISGVADVGLRKRNARNPNFPTS